MRKFDEYSFTLKEMGDSKKKDYVSQKSLDVGERNNFFIPIEKGKIRIQKGGKFEMKPKRQTFHSPCIRKVKNVSEGSLFSGKNRSFEKKNNNWMEDPFLVKKGFRNVSKTYSKARIVSSGKLRPLKPKYGSCSNIKFTKRSLKTMISQKIKKLNTPKTAAFSRADLLSNCHTPDAARLASYRPFNSPSMARSSQNSKSRSRTKSRNYYKTPQPRRPDDMFKNPVQKKIIITPNNVLKQRFRPQAIDDIVELAEKVKKLKSAIDKENAQEFKIESFRKLVLDHKGNTDSLSNSKAYRNTNKELSRVNFLDMFLDNIKDLRKKKQNLFHENKIKSNEIKSLKHKIAIQQENYFQKVKKHLKMKSKINLENNITTFKINYFDRETENLKSRHSANKKEINKLIFEHKLYTEKKSRSDFLEQLYSNYTKLDKKKDKEINNLIKKIEYLRSRKAYIHRFNPR